MLGSTGPPLQDRRTRWRHGIRHLHCVVTHVQRDGGIDVTVDAGDQNPAPQPPGPPRARRRTAPAAVGASIVLVLGVTADTLGVVDWAKDNLLDQRVITSNEEPLGVEPRTVVVSGDELPAGEQLWVRTENVKGQLFPLAEAHYDAQDGEYTARLQPEQYGPRPETLTVHAVVADASAAADFDEYLVEAADDSERYETGIGEDLPSGATVIDSFP
jgi:hypothetical protein